MSETTTKQAARKGVPFVFLLTAAILFAKLTFFTAIPWFWVFAPVLICVLAAFIYYAIPVAFFLAAAIVVGVVWVFATAIDGCKGLSAWRRQKRADAILKRAGLAS